MTEPVFENRASKWTLSWKDVLSDILQNKDEVPEQSHAQRILSFWFVYDLETNTIFNNFSSFSCYNATFLYFLQFLSHLQCKFYNLLH